MVAGRTSSVERGRSQTLFDSGSLSSIEFSRTLSGLFSILLSVVLISATAMASVYAATQPTIMDPVIIPNSSNGARDGSNGTRDSSSGTDGPVPDLYQPALRGINGSGAAAPGSSSASDSAGGAGLHGTAGSAGPARSSGSAGTAGSLGAAAQRPNPLLKGTVSLHQALDEAFLNNPRTSAIRSQLGIARAAYWQASVLPNPSMFVDYSENSNCKYGIQVPIEMPWRIVFRMIAAKRTVQQSAADIGKFLWQFRGLVRRAYVEYFVAQEMAELRERLLDLTRRGKDVASTRYGAGDVPGLDVRRADLLAIQAEVDSVQANQTLIQTREMLNNIMARNIDAPLEVPHLEVSSTEEQLIASGILPNFGAALPDRDKLIGDAMVSRFELISIGRQIQLARANLHNAEGNIIPTWRFIFGRFNAYNLPKGPATTTFYFNANAEMPVTNLQQGDIARFRAMTRQLTFERQGQQNIITGEVVLAYRKLAAARARLNLIRNRALAASQAVIVISQHGYELGQSDMNVYLDSARADIAVRSLFLDALLQYQLALNDLEQAVGHPLD